MEIYLTLLIFFSAAFIAGFFFSLTLGYGISAKENARIIMGYYITNLIHLLIISLTLYCLHLERNPGFSNFASKIAYHPLAIIVNSLGVLAFLFFLVYGFKYRVFDYELFSRSLSRLNWFIILLCAIVIGLKI